MKKLLMVFAGLLMTSLVHAAPLFKEGVNYDVVKQTAAAKPEVMEFFSYFCPHCYQFEPIIADLKKSVGSEVTFKRNPVSFLGQNMGIELQKAYAVAKLLGVEEKFSPAMFKVIQVDRNPPKDRAAVKAVFESIGVKGSDFDGAIDSFAVVGQASQFDHNTESFNIRGVPATVVNGKYLLKTESIKSEQEYMELVKFLLQKKD
jgi:DSBA-like thioredoxin domain.